MKLNELNIRPMVKFRSVVAILLAFVTSLMLTACSGGAVAKKPPTYTSAQLELIQSYAGDLQTMRDRLPELATLITRKDWTFARNFIHGPLGELRVKMSAVARNLLPDARAGAETIAKTVFADLEAIDLAAQDANYSVAIKNYAAALKDFDAFLSLVPPAARPQTQATAKTEAPELD